MTARRGIIRLAREAGVPILIDPKGSDFSIYSGANIITPNLKEFETIVGHCHNNEEIAERGQSFLREYDINALLLTRGEQGMTLIQQNQEENPSARACT